jgi:hypothetical protein
VRRLERRDDRSLASQFDEMLEQRVIGLVGWLIPQRHAYRLHVLERPRPRTRAFGNVPRNQFCSLWRGSLAVTRVARYAGQS